MSAGSFVTSRYESNGGGIFKVPVLSPDTYDAWTTPAGQTGTYLAAPVQVVGQSPERKR